MKTILLLILSIWILNNSDLWVYNFNEALNLAKEKNQKVLMVFAGSDWCIPCKKFEKTILDDSQFEDFQKKNLVILYLDFPVKKKNQLSDRQKLHNEHLAEKYNPSGVFPKILLISPDGEIVKEIKFKNQDAKEFIEQVNVAE